MLNTDDISTVAIATDETKASSRTVAESASSHHPVHPSHAHLIGNWLFLIGSLIFTVDGAIELIEGVSLHAVLHFSASVLFTIGSVLFLWRSQESGVRSQEPGVRSQNEQNF
ncbi:MAG TPA: hypothetical protein V6C78_23810 [Crinalium sp.]